MAAIATLIGNINDAAAFLFHGATERNVPRSLPLPPLSLPFPGQSTTRIRARTAIAD